MVTTRRSAAVAAAAAIKKTARAESVNRSAQKPRNTSARKQDTSKKATSVESLGESESEISDEISDEDTDEKVKEDIEDEKKPPIAHATDDTESDNDDEDNTDSDDDSDDNESVDESDASDSDDDQDEEDLDQLLQKAQSALKTQQNDTIKFDDDNAASALKLPKLNPGVNVDKQLYLQAKGNGAVSFAKDAVHVKDTNDKTNKDALVTLKTTTNQEVAKPMSRKERQKERAKTSGSGWFDMPLGEMTEENKRDLQILRMRHVLDRKRHYRKMDKKHQPKYFQIGTLIEGATEFYSARLNRKDRKQTITEEIMGDSHHTDYYKRKYGEIQQAKTSGGKRYNKNKKAKRY